MATEAQLIANRLNARKSTGPRTHQGKSIVSQNALKHGLSSAKTITADEDPADFALQLLHATGDSEHQGKITTG